MLLRLHNKNDSNDSILALPTRRPRGGYDRRATGISFDFVYKPESYAQQAIAGGYGEPVESEIAFAALSNLESDSYLGVTICGTPAGIDYGKRLVHHFENWGYGHGYVFDTTKNIGVLPLKDALGLGACPGNSVILSPSGWVEDLDTLFHEYLHNCGLDHQYDERGNQINRGSDPIYLDAAKVRRHLGSFPAP